MGGSNLQGYDVEANYMGDIPIRGHCLSSRTKWGGGVHHRVRLESGFIACEGKVVRRAGEVVFVEHSEITRLRDPSTL